MPNASVNIFHKEIKQEENAILNLPKEVFETAKEVIQTKSQKILKTKDGFFIISYSENGPFTEKISKDWLPVQIICVKKWSSGGIKTSEMKDFEDEFL